MSIWNKHPDYAPDELRVLTSVAAETLVDAADDPAITPDLLRVSTRSAAGQIQAALPEHAADREALQALLEEPEQAAQLAIFVLDQIRQVPALAEQVAEAYEARRREMFSPELLLLAGAAVILAIKVKRFRVSKNGISGDFYEAGEAVKSFVTGLAKAIPKTGS